MAENVIPELLNEIQRLAAELHPDLATNTVDLDSSLDRDLGLDSLARMELMSRLEKRFALRLPEQAMATAETPRDILRSLERCSTTASATPIQPTSSETPPPTDASVQDRASTLVEVLTIHAASTPERLHIILEGQQEDNTTINYRELHLGAQRIAAGLQEAGLSPGDTVALILPTGRDYFFSFFGVLLAGGVPVPLYPPVRPSQIEEHLRRHSNILRNAGVKILLTVPEVIPIARLLRLQVETLSSVATVAELVAGNKTFLPVPLRPEDIAFLQYTSGSTGDPKGVILTHANLLANIRAMGKATDTTARDVFVSWLPLYHDMGLIGAWLGSLYFGCRLVIMPPLSFLARPERWLSAIHRHRGTLAASPNFGYELCARRISDEDIKDLDLSSWRLAFNGAEQVTADTVSSFCHRFKPYGFREEAMAPVYGLAESSVGLAFPPIGRKPLVDRIEREAFVRSGKAVPDKGQEQQPLTFVACGRPLPGHQIRIVDPAGRELPDRHEGILQFKGPSATSGYYHNLEKTRALFRGDWLDSGDRAYMADGDLYVTGRIKDIIIRAGRNVYPHELEEAVGNLEGIRKGSVAVFGSRDKAGGTERLVILAESRKKNPDSVEQLRRAVSDIAVDLLGTPPDEVVIAPPGTVLKTSSGKIRRAACKEIYEQGRIGRPGRAVWLQVSRLIAAGILPQARKILRLLIDNLFAAYAWSVYGLLCLPVWPLVVLLPGRRVRWRITRIGSRLLALLTGTRLEVEGTGNVPLHQAVIVVANHMSYLDAYVVQAVLPVPCGFIAKAELAKRPLVGIPLARLGAIMVERFDRERVSSDTGRLGQLISTGQSLFFFPEGTFQRLPGLLPFRMGAFLTAAKAGIPVVPLTIRGTRNMLRSGSWFPRRGKISVVIGTPIAPDGDDWAAAIRLRETVRREILSHLGEPDLADAFTPFADLHQATHNGEQSRVHGDRSETNGPPPTRPVG